MKRELGVGVAALSALAAEGKDFSREELNAMLDKLAASPEPKVRNMAFATCYVMARPTPERYEHVCRKCGTHTIYPANRLCMANKIARFRDEAAHLRALGLDITLDESPLCMKCTPVKEIGVAISGTIIGKPTGKDAARFPFAVGDKVKIFDSIAGRYRVAPLHKEYWIYAKYISESGKLLGHDVNIRQEPRIGSFVHATYWSCDPLKRLPARPGDPPDWVRVELPPSLSEQGGVNIRKKYIGELSYDEGNSPSPRRFAKLAWIINGKWTIARNDDAKILEAFLKGRDVRAGRRDEKRALKRDIVRLRELLDPDFVILGVNTPDDEEEVDVEVDL